MSQSLFISGTTPMGSIKGEDDEGGVLDIAAAGEPGDVSNHTDSGDDEFNARASNVDNSGEVQGNAADEDNAEDNQENNDSGSLSPAMVDMIQNFLANLDRQAQRDLAAKLAAGEAANARALAAGKAENARELAEGKAAIARELAEGKAAIARELATGRATNIRVINQHLIAYSDAKSSEIDAGIEVEQAAYERGCAALAENYEERHRTLQADFEEKLRTLKEKYAEKKRDTRQEYAEESNQLINDYNDSVRAFDEQINELEERNNQRKLELAAEFENEKASYTTLLDEQWEKDAQKYQKRLNDLAARNDRKKLELEESFARHKATRKAALDVDMEEEKKKRTAELDNEMEEQKKERMATLDREIDEARKKGYAAMEMEMDQARINRLAELDAGIMPPPNTVDADSSVSLQAPTSNTAAGTLSQIESSLIHSLLISLIAEGTGPAIPKDTATNKAPVEGKADAGGLLQRAHPPYIPANTLNTDQDVVQATGRLPDNGNPTMDSPKRLEPATGAEKPVNKAARPDTTESLSNPSPTPNTATGLENPNTSANVVARPGDHKSLKRNIDGLSDDEKSDGETESTERAPKRIRGASGTAFPVTTKPEEPEQAASPQITKDTLPSSDDLSSESDAADDQIAASSHNLLSQPKPDDGPSNEATTHDQESRYFFRSRLNPSEESLKAAAQASPKKRRGPRASATKGVEAMFGDFLP